MNEKKHLGGILTKLNVLEAVNLLKQYGGHIKRPNFQGCDYIYCNNEGYLHYKDWQFRFLVNSMAIENVLATDWIHIYGR